MKLLHNSKITPTMSFLLTAHRGDLTFRFLSFIYSKQPERFYCIDQGSALTPFKDKEGQTEQQTTINLVR